MKLNLAMLQRLFNGSIFSRYLTSLNTIVVEASAFTWTYLLGMPSHAHSVAGAGFAIFGCLIVCLLLRSNAHWKWTKRHNWISEILVIKPNMIRFTDDVFLGSGSNKCHTREYLAINTGYEIATEVTVFIPFPIGFLMPIYSAETARYRMSWGWIHSEI